MATLPDIPYSYLVSKTTKARVLSANLGDGYTQRAKDGLNSISDEWSISWDVNETNADTLTDFFVTHGGADSFDWTPPTEGSSKKWVASSWDKKPSKVTDFNGSEIFKISVKLKETFDLI